MASMDNINLKILAEEELNRLRLNLPIIDSKPIKSGCEVIAKEMSFFGLFKIRFNKGGYFFELLTKLGV